jgi:hypothetical protein
MKFEYGIYIYLGVLVICSICVCIYNLFRCRLCLFTYWLLILHLDEVQCNSGPCPLLPLPLAGWLNRESV